MPDAFEVLSTSPVTAVRLPAAPGDDGRLNVLKKQRFWVRLGLGVGERLAEVIRLLNLIKNSQKGAGVTQGEEVLGGKPCTSP